jgi:hypothetical protein
MWPRLLLLTGLLMGGTAQAQQSIVGRWEVRHSALGHVWVFSPNGHFEYTRYQANFGAINVLGRTGGTYEVQGSRITFKGDDGSVFRTTYRFAPNAVSLGRNALYIVMKDGTEEMFFS